ncbi:response regulator transcription factor [Actinoplanes xinjiangensis]|jgi:two-component system response regulator DesR|uniref:LuxR family two component transcriptional regulator n=1 Tax=Actinoplanes xinjiangensis TaxID=512350 RepID=A0A316FJZ6_9ACTN|nr:response regulator transcription factor [Actinoplanes xinjiangensis]PWK49034.1 LuxR family two component transcriptional regulator [Actinoplanes xinjiangensis]GIF38741.1 DNA-binding response regulator [Actinoplanes xinjiangensis]
MIRVLLADDQHLIREALAMMLDFEDDLTVVAQCGRGDDVLPAVAAHDPDVIVLDIEMPGLDGLTVAERLPGRAMLILSTFARPGYLRRAIAAGVRGFIPKDASSAELAEAIRRIHAGGRYLDPELAASAMMAGESPLTDRERDTLTLAASGASVADIAARLHLSEGTVRNYLSNAMTKLGAPNRLTAIHQAQRMGWI